MGLGIWLPAIFLWIFFLVIIVISISNQSGGRSNRGLSGGLLGQWGQLWLGMITGKVKSGGFSFIHLILLFITLVCSTKQRNRSVHPSTRYSPKRE